MLDRHLRQRGVRFYLVPACIMLELPSTWGVRFYFGLDPALEAARDKSVSAGEWLKEHNVPALSGLDTRMLTKKIREKGALLGKIQFPGENIPFVDPNETNLVCVISWWHILPLPGTQRHFFVCFSTVAKFVFFVFMCFFLAGDFFKKNFKIFWIFFGSEKYGPDLFETKPFVFVIIGCFGQHVAYFQNQDIPI